MVFKDNESLSSLYEGITKRVEPSADQLVQQAPILSNTQLSKDQDMLAEAYNVMTNRGAKEKHCAGCDCDDCEECKANQETIKEAKKTKKLSAAQKKIAQAAPPPDEITGADFASLKKKKTMREGLSFKDLYNAVMNESKKQEVVCGTKINPQFEYKCTMKDGTEKTLKGKSVLGMKDKLKSVKAA